MTKFTTRVQNIAGKGTSAWRAHQQGKLREANGEDIIFLTVGDPDFDAPQPVIQQATASLQSGRTHYAPLMGQNELRTTIAAYHNKYTGGNAGIDNVVAVQGAQNGMCCAALTVLEAGDEVITPEPYYTTYNAVVGVTGAQICSAPLLPENSWQIDPDAIEKAVTPRTRAIILNSPHNPTGSVILRENIEAIGEICQQHDLWLISDEVYSHMCYDSPHVPPVSLPGMAERTITVSSLSKSHAMSGFRLGWVVATPEVIAHIGNILTGMLYGMPPFIQDAGIVALNLDPDLLAPMREEYRRRRDYFCDLMDEMPLVQCHRPQGGIFVMLDVRETGLTPAEFSRRLLEEEKVAVLPADSFGASAAGHVRISLTAPTIRLQTAAERMAGFIHRLI